MNCPMNRNATAAMPRATLESASKRRDPVADAALRSLGIAGSVKACHINAKAASGRTQKNAPLQPIMPPR
ncbi:hypothetical protein D3C79_806160 [compost metagenome]